MANKFNVGDSVRIIGVSAGSSNVYSLGEIHTVRKVHQDWSAPYSLKDSDEERDAFYEDELELVKAGKISQTKKQKPYKFALQYELDKDPTEYFNTIEEVKKRVKELASNPSLKKDEVFVHEIKNTKKISITNIIGIKFVTIK